MQPALLQNINQIDRKWVADALNAGDIHTSEISYVDYTPIGNGNSSDVYQISFSTKVNTSSVTEILVLKMHSSNRDTVDAAAGAGVYRSEHEIVKILKTVSAVNTPEYYYSSISEDGRQANILMEALTDQYETGDQIKGITFEQAKAAALELSKLHAHFWESSSLNDLNLTTGLDGSYHAIGAKNIHERLGEKLSIKEMEIIDKSLTFVDDWLQCTPSFRTLIHSDCRADNIIFREMEDGRSKAYIIDWASCRIGDPMSDIAYLMCSSVSQNERKEFEDAILEDCVREISKVQTDYTIDVAKSAYRENITSSMYMTLIAAAFIPQNPQTDLLLETLARRNCAALSDWLDLS